MVERISENDVQIKEILYKQQGKVEVYKVMLYRTGETLCMKKIFVENIMEATAMNNECLAMATYNHSNIIKLRSTSFGGVDREITHLVIFMEYFEEGDLEKLIFPRTKNRNFFTEEELMEYLIQLVSAYAYMERLGCAHRDIKPQNIFVCNQGRVLKVGDLGSSVKKEQNSGVTITGTPLYLSPKLREAYARTAYETPSKITHDIYKSDVYSLGLTFLYVASLDPVKDLTSLVDLEAKLANRINQIANRYTNLAVILQRMLDINENNRPNFIGLEDRLSGRSTIVELNTNVPSNNT